MSLHEALTSRPRPPEYYGAKLENYPGKGLDFEKPGKPEHVEG